jgi:hypothetical protein
MALQVVEDASSLTQVLRGHFNTVSSQIHEDTNSSQSDSVVIQGGVSVERSTLGDDLLLFIK